MYRAGLKLGVIAYLGYGGLPLGICMDTIADEELPTTCQGVENIDACETHAMCDGHDVLNHAMGGNGRAWSFYRATLQRRGKADKNTPMGGEIQKMSR